MINPKFILYINGQSIRPLVNSIREAKRYAEAHLAFSPSLRIECFKNPIVACAWTYDHQAKAWKRALCRERLDCCSATECAGE